MESESQGRCENGDERMRRTKEAARETRNRILDAAEHVFVARGFAATTLSEIADAASVTRGAIYGHFENKHDLLTSMIERSGLPTETLIREVANARDPDSLGHMRKVFATSLRDAARHPQAWRMHAITFRKHEVGGESYPVFARCQRAAKELQISLQSALRIAVQRGQLPGNLDVEYSSALLLALWNGALTECLFDPNATLSGGDAERIAQSWLDILRFSPTCLGAA